jgi:hypothetical protein
MNTLKVQPFLKTGIRKKKYTIIALVINSMLNRSVRKRFLNFYDPIRPLTK